jgi:hypothetical protein
MVLKGDPYLKKVCPSSGSMGPLDFQSYLNEKNAWTSFLGTGTSLFPVVIVSS